MSKILESVVALVKTMNIPEPEASLSHWHCRMQTLGIKYEKIQKSLTVLTVSFTSRSLCIARSLPTCRVCLSILPSIRLSRWWIVSKRLTLPSNFSSPGGPMILVFAQETRLWNSDGVITKIRNHSRSTDDLEWRLNFELFCFIDLSFHAHELLLLLLPQHIFQYLWNGWSFAVCTWNLAN